MRFRKGEPATLHRRIITGYDAAKRPQHGWELEALPGGAFAPTGGSGANLEPPEVGHSTVIHPARVYFREPVEIKPGYRIEIRGRVFDVVGEPEVWISPRTGNYVGTVVYLQYTSQGA